MTGSELLGVGTNVLSDVPLRGVIGGKCEEVTDVGYLS